MHIVFFCIFELDENINIFKQLKHKARLFQWVHILVLVTGYFDYFIKFYIALKLYIYSIYLI